MYDVFLSFENIELVDIEVKSITQVCKILETVNFDLCEVEIIRSNGTTVNVDELMEIWFNV